LCNDITTADFNGDGKLDLAMADGGGFLDLDGSVKIVLGNGDGTFRSPQPLREKVRPDRIAAGDFNLDGNLDLAVSLEHRTFDWDVEILLGHGDGTFATPRPLGLTDDLISGVVAADVDRDGKLDLGISLGSEIAVGFRGNGDGTFEPALRGPMSGNLLVIDLDRDGWPDIISPSHIGGFVAVLRNTAAETGLLRPALTFLRAASGLELSWPGAFKNFNLKQTDSLSAPGPWTPATNAVTFTNERFRALIESLSGARFFRLEKPE
jgi:hypothetical protein